MWLIRDRTVVVGPNCHKLQLTPVYLATLWSSLVGFTSTVGRTAERPSVVREDMNNKAVTEPRDQLLHVKDQFGNDMWFGDAGAVRVAAVPHVDYRGLLDRIRDFDLRHDDVIVVGYPKSGNNWTHHMVSMLLEGSTRLPTLFVDGNFPFLEGLRDECQPPSSDKPRAFITHLPFRFLPRDVVNKKVKVVYQNRNPKDIFVSLFNHVTKTKPPIGYEGSWEQFFTVLLDQGYWYGDVFEYLKRWEKVIDDYPEVPIHNCNYESLKLDTLKEVKKLDVFLGTGRSEDFCRDVVDTCRLDNMHVTRQQSERIFRDTWLWKMDHPPSSFYRKGIIGDWKNWFTVEQNERFEDVYRTKMADSRLTFIFQ